MSDDPRLVISPAIDRALFQAPGGARRWQRFTQRYAALLALSRRQRRALVRRWRLSLAGIALALTLGLAAPLHAAPAATIVVDEVTCTLAQAITTANDGTPQGACTTGDAAGADTIDLQADVALNATLPTITGDLTLQGNGYTIDGAYAYALLTIDAGVNATVDNITLRAGYSVNGAAINNAGALTLTGSTLEYNEATGSGGALYNSGSATITNSDLTDNYASYYGGAIYNSGTLTITTSTVAYNEAGGDGGGLYTAGSQPVNIDDTTFAYNTAGSLGGGIASFSPITITNSTLHNNTADNAGGGAYLCGAGATATISGSEIRDNEAAYGAGLLHTVPLTIDNSTLSGNQAQLMGGGLMTSYAPLIMTYSTLNNNSAKYGGGALLYAANGRIAASTLTGNSVSGSGGALYVVGGNFTLNRSTLSGNMAYENGGGVAIGLDAQLAINNSTLSGNSAQYNGGGVYVAQGAVTLYASTLTANSATDGGGVMVLDDPDFLAAATLNRSVISGNSATGGGPELFNLTYIYGDAYNVIGQNGDAGSYGFVPGASDVVPAGAATTVLAPLLADNGGPTLTHNLVAGSPAIDLAPSGPAVDQRGAPRPVGTRAGDFDAGSVEYLGVPNAIELATFSALALADGGGARITWETASEINSAGFNLLRGRAADGSDRQAVNAGLIAATGSNGLGAAYVYDDTTAGAGTWYYWLAAIDSAGQTTLHGPVSVELSAPTAVTLSGAAAAAGGLTNLVAAALLLALATLAGWLRRLVKG